jgi:ribA/ribD-fused uncharacterized protein
MKNSKLMEHFTFFHRSSSLFSQWNTDTPFFKYGIRFKTAENFMMYRKGMLFGAEQTLLDDILNSDARDAKALGKKIPNFNQAIWDVAAKPLVAEGSYAKFSQNPQALITLLATDGTTLVEASPSDRIWGIGLSAHDHRARDRKTWLGLNWLGEVLTDVRDTFLKVRNISQSGGNC